LKVNIVLYEQPLHELHQLYKKRIRRHFGIKANSMCEGIDGCLVVASSEEGAKYTHTVQYTQLAYIMLSLLSSRLLVSRLLDHCESLGLCISEQVLD
jgi:hypothetical protein